MGSTVGPKNFARPGQIGADQQPSRMVMPLPPPTQSVAPQPPPVIAPVQQTVTATPAVASPNSTPRDITSIEPRSPWAARKMNQYSEYL